MEFAGHQVLDFAGCRRKDKGQTIDLGICCSDGLDTTGRILDNALRSPDNKGECEDELVIAAKLQQERRTSTVAGLFGILPQQSSLGSLLLLVPCDHKREGRTRTNSTGAESPDDRDADTLVAGNALGTMLIAVRRFGLAMTAEEMDTARESQYLGVEN